jgi:ankyrin repeat protein
MWAVELGDTKSTKILLERGADVSIKNKDGLTALGIAIKNKRQSIALLLRSTGARE